MPNLAWWPVVALGVWRAGAAISPLSPLWTADESARVLARAAPRLAIAFAPLRGRACAARWRAPASHDVDARGPRRRGRRRHAHRGAAGARRGRPLRRARPRTRRPRRRAVLQRHRRAAQGRAPHARQPRRGGRAGDQPPSAPAAPTTSARWSWPAAPFFHSIGLALMLCAPLSLGAHDRHPPPPRRSSRCWSSSPRTASPTSPCRRRSSTRSRRDPRVDEHDLSSLRLVVTGGAHMHRRRRAGAQRAPGLRGAPGLRDDRDDVHDQRSAGRPSTPGTVGWLMPGTEARLVDPETGVGRRARRAGRAVGPRPAGHAGLPRPARGHRRDPHARRLAAHRRPRRHPRRRPARDPRPPQGAHQGQGRLGGAGRDRARAAPAPGRARRRRGGRPRRRARRGADRVRGARRSRRAGELEDFAAARLARYKRPREIVVVDEVPRAGRPASSCAARCASALARPSARRPPPSAAASPRPARRAARRSRRACPPGRPG